MRSARRRRRTDRGAQTLDFAIWFPVVLIALLSTVQLCFDLYAQRQADQFANAAVVRLADGDSVAEVADSLRSALGADATVAIRDGQVRVRVGSASVAPWIPGHGGVGDADLTTRSR